MSTKSWLKKAKEFINEKDYEQALDTCQQILQWEPENYTALVFLGLSCLNLKKIEQAEEAYKKATVLNVTAPLAWQGLCNLYNTIGAFQSLCETYKKLIEVYHSSNLGPKVLETIDKLLTIYSKDHIDAEEYMNTLMLQLPDSSIYDSIKDLPELPNQIDVLRKMQEFQENNDQSSITKLYDSRRRRLTSDSLDTIKKNVIIEVLSKSKLEDVYERLIRVNDQLSYDDNLKINQKYLSFLHQCISVGIPSDLPSKFHKMIELTKYCIQTGSPYFLPYQIELEYQNVPSSNDYDQNVIDHSLTIEDNSDFFKFLQVYHKFKIQDPEIHFDQLLNFKKSLKNSIFYLHQMAYLSFQSELYSECQYFCSILIEIVNNLIKSTDYDLYQVWESAQLTMANAYLKMENKFHQLAYPIFIQLLQKFPSSIRALEGLSNYLIESHQFDIAMDHLKSGLKIDPNNSILLSSIGWVYFLKKDFSSSIENLKTSIGINPNEALTSYRLGRVYWEMGGDFATDRSFAMSCWIQSAKLDPSHSDTFHHLGHFYLLVEQDRVRAKKCYQKAVSLQSSNLNAIKDLYDLSVADDDLEFAQGLIVLATQSVPYASWGWRKLGFLQLSTKEYPSAITSFQNGLRIDNKDHTIWEGLGEAYFNEGRYMASLKAFQRGLKLEPKAYACSYYIALVSMKVGDYKIAIEALNGIFGSLENDPINQSIYELPCYKSLLDCYIIQAKEEFTQGLYGKMVETIFQTFNLLQIILKKYSQIGIIWEITGDLILMLRFVGNYLMPNQLTLIQAIYNQIQALSKNYPHGRDILGKDLELVEALLEQSNPSQVDLIHICLLTGVLCYRFVILVSNSSSPEFLSSYLYKIAFAYTSCHYFQENQNVTITTYLEFASKTMQLAIKHQPDNFLNWNLLGLIYMKTNPKLSRDALVQSILREPKGHMPYTNYGYLCWMQMDYDLANQAFVYAQRLEPEYVSAWLGQTLVAKSLNSTDLLELATHAYNINEGQSSQVYLEYAEALFLDNKTNPNGLKLDQLNSGMFSMSKYVELIQNKPFAYNLLALFLEQLEMVEKASFMLQIGIQQLKVDKSKKPINYTVCLMVNYARILCSLGKYSESIQMYLDADVLNQKRKDPGNPSDQARASLGLGLAYYYNQDLQASFAQFERALTLADGHPALARDVRLLLSQVLWALGASNHRQLAKEQLLDCIRNQSQSLPILFGLCAMGILDKDFTLTSAALQEISKTSFESRKEDFYGHLEYLSSCAYLIQNQFSNAKSTLSKALHLYPTNPFHWARLGSFLNKVYPQLAFYTVMLIERALDHAQKVPVTPQEKSYLHQVQSEAYLLVGEYRWAKVSAQKSLMILPNNLQSRRFLATSIALIQGNQLQVDSSDFKTIRNLIEFTEPLSQSNKLSKHEGFSYSESNLIQWNESIEQYCKDQLVN